MSMDLHIALDDTELKTALAGAAREIPTATRNALNDTLRDVQKAEREKVTRVFHLRQKQFILHSIKIPREGGKATKDLFRGEVGVDPLRDHLAKHEEGGDFPSFKGKPRVPIPSRDIRTGKGGQVRPSTVLKNFLPFAMATSLNQVRLTGSVMLPGRRQATAVPHRREQLVGQRGSFFIRTRQGDPMLVRRSRGGQIQRLWIWYPEKRIRPRLGFYETAAATVPSAWEKNVAAAISHALRRAGLT